MAEQLNRAFARSSRVLISLATITLCILSLSLGGAALETVARRAAERGAALRSALIVQPAPGAGAETATQAAHLPQVAGTVGFFHTTYSDDLLRESGWGEVEVWATCSRAPGWEYAPPVPGLRLASGRLPQSPEEALLGAELARALDLEVGGAVWVQGRPLTVAGIWEPAGLAAGNYLQIPYQTALLLFPETAHDLDPIYLLTSGDAIPSGMPAEVQMRLPGATVSLPESLWADEARLLRVLAALVAALALLAALAGGPAAVHALRPLAGPRSETAAAAGVLGALGGGFGLALAWAAAILLNAVALRDYALTPLTLTPRLAALALLWPALAGGLAGLVAQRRRAGEMGRLWRYAVAAATVALSVSLVLLAGGLEGSLTTALQRTRAGNADRLSAGLSGGTLPGEVLSQALALPGLQGVLVESYGGALDVDEDSRPGRPPSGVVYGLLSPDGSTGTETPYPVRLAEGRAISALDETIVGAGLARRHGLALGDLLAIRGRDFTVVGIREPFPYDALSPVNYRADVSLDALQFLPAAPAARQQLTLLVPPTTDTAERAPFLQRAGALLRGASLTDIEDRLAEVAACYPGARTLTGQDPVAHAQELYRRLSLACAGLGILLSGLAVVLALYPVYLEQRRDAALYRLLGAGPGSILASYLWSALALALVGVLLGSYTALSFAGALNAYFGPSTAWPALTVTARRLALIGLGAGGGVLLCALYPGLRAAGADLGWVLRPVPGRGAVPRAGDEGLHELAAQPGPLRRSR